MLSPLNHEPEVQRKAPNHKVKAPSSSLFQRADYFVEDNVGFQSGARNRSGFKLVLWSWMSTFIDALILISISCFCMILFSVLMKTPARDVFRFISLEPSMGRLFLSSFLVSFWAYLVVMRLFMGASLGEWSCQLRLGQPVERLKGNYALRVIGRTTLILSTGVIVLPLISLLMGRDLAGEVSGVKIYSLT